MIIIYGEYFIDILGNLDVWLYKGKYIYNNINFLMIKDRNMGVDNCFYIEGYSVFVKMVS